VESGSGEVGGIAMLFLDSDETVGFAKRKRRKYDLIVNREDGCIGADTESQGENDKSSESGLVGEHPESMAEITEHEHTSPSVDRRQRSGKVTKLS
jgi:hypothetical protein